LANLKLNFIFDTWRELDIFYDGVEGILLIFPFWRCSRPRKTKRTSYRLICFFLHKVLYIPYIESCYIFRRKFYSSHDISGFLEKSRTFRIAESRNFISRYNILSYTCIAPVAYNGRNVFFFNIINTIWPFNYYNIIRYKLLYSGDFKTIVYRIRFLIDGQFYSADYVFLARDTCRYRYCFFLVPTILNYELIDLSKEVR